MKRLVACLGLTCLLLWMIYRARRRRDYPLISLANAVEHMKTGDLVLFSGRSISTSGNAVEIARRIAFLGKNGAQAHPRGPNVVRTNIGFEGATYTYRAVDKCEFGHVAVVYKRDGKAYLVHSEHSNSETDLFSGESVTGVQVTSLEEKLAHYKGYAVWRPINKAIPEEKLLDFLGRTYHMHYRVPGDVVMRLIDRLLKAKRHGKAGAIFSEPGLLCTEFVGALYEYCGVFDKEMTPYKTYYLPSDFTQKKMARHLLPEYTFNNEGWEIVGEMLSPA